MSKNFNKLGELYTIKDCIADDFGPVFQCKNVGVARRNTMQLLSKAVDARDYELYYIGDILFDCETGKIGVDSDFHVCDIMAIDSIKSEV